MTKVTATPPAVEDAGMATPEDWWSTAAVARLGSLLFVAAGVVITVTAPLVEGTRTVSLLFVSGAAAAVGLVCLLMPWDRWPRWSLLAQTMVALVMIVVSARLVPSALDHYMPIFIVVLLYVGITQPMRTVLEMIAVVVLAFVLAAGPPGADLYAEFAVTLGIGVATASTLALLVAQFVEADRRALTMLGVGRALARAESTDEAVGLVERVARDLLEADMVLTFLADPPGGSRLVTVLETPDGMPDELCFRLGSDDWQIAEHLASGESRFVDDVAGGGPVGERLAELSGARAAFILPLFDAGKTLGGLVCTWRSRRRAPKPVVVKALEHLATEGGVAVDRLRAAERDRRHAATDPLTGLLNRREMEARLTALAEGDTLIVADVDHFKAVNDGLGHAAGDQVLRTFAAMLADNCRRSDWCARIGGDEFLVVLRGGGEAGARTFLHGIRAEWGRIGAGATFSAGAAVAGPGDESRQVLARADDALYRAKASGRDCDRVLRAVPLGAGPF